MFRSFHAPVITFLRGIVCMGQGKSETFLCCDPRGLFRECFLHRGPLLFSLERCQNKSMNSGEQNREETLFFCGNARHSARRQWSMKQKRVGTDWQKILGKTITKHRHCCQNVSLWSVDSSQKGWKYCCSLNCGNSRWENKKNFFFSLENEECAVGKWILGEV